MFDKFNARSLEWTAMPPHHQTFDQLPCDQFEASEICQFRRVLGKRLIRTYSSCPIRLYGGGKIEEPTLTVLLEIRQLNSWGPLQQVSER